MKKLIRLAMCCLVAVNVLAVPVFAGVPSPANYTSVEQESDLCDKSVSYDIDIARPVARRGNFFISADVAIKDGGNGNIIATGHAYLAKPVTELYVSFYLDRYDESLKKWKQVDYRDFEFTLEEYPEGIDDPSITVTFENQKKGYYYRIRGAFTAGDEEKVEGFGPTTDGIWIE